MIPLVEKMMGEGTPFSIAQIQFKTYDFVKRLALLNRKSKVLDVGCGSGYGAYHLSNQAEGKIEVDAIDVVPWGCWNDTMNLKFSEIDATEMFLGEQEYDLIISSQNIEHLIDPIKSILLSSKMLKNDGTAIYATPNRDLSLVHLEHWYEFSPSELDKVCRCAFAEVDIYYQHIDEDEYYRIKKKTNSPSNVARHMINKCKIFLKGGIIAKNPFLRNGQVKRKSTQLSSDEVLDYVKKMGQASNARYELTPSSQVPKMVPMFLVAVCRKPIVEAHIGISQRLKYMVAPLFHVH